MTRQRVLLVISAQPQPDLRNEIARASQPRRDYFELAAALDADTLHPADVRADPAARLVARAAGMRAGLAWLAFHRRHQYDAIYTDSEGIGLPLAALLKFGRAPAGQPRHIMLTHYLSPAKKRVWFRLDAQSHLDAVICHSSAQRELLTMRLGVAPERVHLLPYFADERYWRPDAGGLPAAMRDGPSKGEGEAPPMVCAVGLEFRDYATLLAAAEGLEADIEIAAASHWSHHSAFAGSPSLPSNVHVAAYEYPALRQLYARSRLVVVPLRAVDNQAGVTVILEAMAMGKAVIVSGTRGQTDVVRDRRNGGRGRMLRQWWPGFVDALDLPDVVGHLPTGFYVTPGDPDELRAATRYLLAHPEIAEELGRNGRRVVEACFGLSAFVSRFAAVIHGQPASTPVSCIESGVTGA